MLVERVTIRSERVFLWVFLVTKPLRRELTDKNTFEDLQATLESFPHELKLFYKHMLDSVRSTLHLKMAGFLQIALVDEES